MNYIKKPILLIVLLLFTELIAHAQVNLFNREGNSDTTITSDKLLLDAEKNIATFTGNVVVDDEEYKIRCDKMIIHKKSKENKEEKKSTSVEMEIIGDNSKVTKIECLGNVIIIRKLTPEEESKDGKQVGTSGKAVFDLVENKITLSKKPVLSQNTKMITADIIVHDLNKSKTEFSGNVKIIRKGKKKED